MKIREIPDGDIIKKTGNRYRTKFIIRSQTGPDGKPVPIEDYFLGIKINGEKIDRGEPLEEIEQAGVYSGNSVGKEETTGPGFTGWKEKEEETIGPGFTGYDPFGTAFSEENPSDSAFIEDNPFKDAFTGKPLDIIDTDENEEKKDEEEKGEDEEKKKKSPIGKYIKRGVITGLAILLLATIAGTKQVTHETTVTPSDYGAVVEVSDLNLISIEGQYVQYAGSVYDDPGQLIHDMRDIAIGENNGTKEGIDEYFAETTDESRVKEEEIILEISNQFQEQQEIIAENEQILKASFTSDQEKKEAIQNIIAAKEEIKNIYSANEELYNLYASKARSAYERDGGDERTNQENELTHLSQTEYRLAIENLGLDINNLESCLYTLDNPQMLFDEQLAPKGTVDTNYIIDIGPVELGMIKETKVTDLEYDPSITMGEGDTTLTSEKINITEKAIQETQTTRKGMFAVIDIIKNAIQKKELGEITIFGHEVHDDPHIK